MGFWLFCFYHSVGWVMWWGLFQLRNKLKFIPTPLFCSSSAIHRPESSTKRVPGCLPQKERQEMEPRYIASESFLQERNRESRWKHAGQTLGANLYIPWKQASKHGRLQKERAKQHPCPPHTHRQAVSHSETIGLFKRGKSSFQLEGAMLKFRAQRLADRWLGFRLEITLVEPATF